MSYFSNTAFGNQKVSILLPVVEKVARMAGLNTANTSEFKKACALFEHLFVIADQNGINFARLYKNGRLNGMEVCYEIFKKSTTCN